MLIWGFQNNVMCQYRTELLIILFTFLIPFLPINLTFLIRQKFDIAVTIYT